jgi:hypothetical protein
MEVVLKRRDMRKSTNSSSCFPLDVVQNIRDAYHFHQWNLSCNRTWKYKDCYDNHYKQNNISQKEKAMTVPLAAVQFLDSGWTVVPWRAEDIISCNHISPRICTAAFTVGSRGYLVRIPDISKTKKQWRAMKFLWRVLHGKWSMASVNYSYGSQRLVVSLSVPRGQ